MNRQEFWCRAFLATLDPRLANGSNEYFVALASARADASLVAYDAKWTQVENAWASGVQDKRR